MTLQTALVVLAMAGQVLLAVDRWVHKREGTEMSLEQRLKEEEKIRFLRAEAVDNRFKFLEDQCTRLDQEIRRLHDNASDYGDGVQKQIGDMEVRWASLKASHESLATVVNLRRR